MSLQAVAASEPPDGALALHAELQRAALLFRRQVLRARRARATAHPLAGLVIAEHEIDTLFDGSDDAIQGSPETRDLDRALARVRSGSDCSDRLARICGLFAIDDFHRDVLLLCLSVDLDRRYEKICGYLNDDVTRHRPTVGLVADILCVGAEQKLSFIARFDQSDPLVGNQLVTFVDEAGSGATLAGRQIAVEPAIVGYLLGDDALAPALSAVARPLVPKDAWEIALIEPAIGHRLRRVLEEWESPAADGVGAVVILEGPNGAGQVGLVAHASALTGREAVLLDAAALPVDEAASRNAVQLLFRDCLIRGVVLLVTEADEVVGAAEGRRALRSTFLAELRRFPGIVFIATRRPWDPGTALGAKVIVHVPLSALSSDRRRRAWEIALAGVEVAATDLGQLAARFRLSPPQIRDAARTAINLARSRVLSSGRVDPGDLYEACRLHSSLPSGSMARRVSARPAWQDIVLPPDVRSQLDEMVLRVTRRDVVDETWGFARKYPATRGLRALFSGASGTGKTMAAQTIAGELELDLYQIDLATVVDKYIGETEKRLERIFAGAEKSSAILFFDEADALFGKRSEVKDARDRYANIEVAYLLQRMESYEGITILATNLRNNIDDAFLRRIDFAIEFRKPTAALRAEIWRRVWPPEAPLGADLDIEFMARTFELTGGHIRNIAVHAAYLAAGDGTSVAMRHLVRATRREYQKLGLLCVEDEFGEYKGLLTSERAA